MTDQEKKFVEEYVRTRNVVQAYMNAYKKRREEFKLEPMQIFTKPEVQKEIEKELYKKEAKPFVSDKDYINFLVRGAFADIGDYMTFKVEEVPDYNTDGTVKIDIDTGEPITRKVNKVYVNNSDTLDTSLITSITNGKDGVKITLVDKMQCWNKLQEHFGWVCDENVKENLSQEILKAIAGQIADNWNGDEDEYAELRATLKKD